MANDVSQFKFYHYDPSMAAAVIFIVCFLSTTTLHTYQLIRTRTWFLIPLVIGGFCKKVCSLNMFTALTIRS
jgi:hypothetical protein